ncbi:hypothetical protein JCGZ_04201 [Jatropha curcas]|uniref:Uncharacterized protein n=1 Tax=Jatropha curcas TaxID=180498 RepID=A0A067J9Y2_JATCU|nr:hypothetical protein JCGZ_04201 [Jatropha curcas]
MRAFFSFRRLFRESRTSKKYSETSFVIFQQQRRKRVMRGSESRAPDTTIIVGKSKHRSGASSPLFWTVQVRLLMAYWRHIFYLCPCLILQVSIDDYNEVCQLYEAAQLKLVVARLLDELISITYEISSYDFRADVVPLRSFVDRALSMDHSSLYWPSLICFCILSQYLLLSGIDGYCSLRLMPIVEQMARRRMPFPFILAETFIWLGEHAQDLSSVLSLMRSLLLLQQLVTPAARSRKTRRWMPHSVPEAPS